MKIREKEILHSNILEKGSFHLTVLKSDLTSGISLLEDIQQITYSYVDSLHVLYNQ